MPMASKGRLGLHPLKPAEAELRNFLYYSYPIYRHPADESPALRPFSPTVSQIRAHVERALQHPVNHVLIQLYRTGADYISEHSDKTIDVVRGSRIVNLSLGARRTMTLRTKKDGAQQQGKASGDDEPEGGHVGDEPEVTVRHTQRVPLPHNSLFVMGLTTNARWMHSVHTDKRPEDTKDPTERGPRISLTFRHIGTFLTPPSSGVAVGSGSSSPTGPQKQFIFGQGATGKTRTEAQSVVHGGEQAERLLAAFGAENHQSEFDWDKAYGKGFDVLHFTALPDSDLGWHNN
jgi:2OG-Fe(II) oxygenase superfamily